MNTAPSPAESELATAEEAAAYDRWFRAKVEAALADTRSGIPHDQVMAEMRAIIAAKRDKAKSVPAVSRARGKSSSIPTTWWSTAFSRR